MQHWAESGSVSFNLTSHIGINRQDITWAFPSLGRTAQLFASPLIISVTLHWTISSIPKSFLYWKPRSGQRPWLCLISAENHFSQLDGSALLMQPRMPLALFAAEVESCHMSRLSSMKSPRCFHEISGFWVALVHMDIGFQICISKAGHINPYRASQQKQVATPRRCTPPAPNGEKWKRYD